MAALIGWSSSHNQSLGLDVICYGIWGGLFYVTAGSLGVAAAHKRTKDL